MYHLCPGLAYPADRELDPADIRISGYPYGYPAELVVVGDIDGGGEGGRLGAGSPRWRPKSELPDWGPPENCREARRRRLSQ
jgi:hypothetical protein